VKLCDVMCRLVCI